jgi:type I restriction enzyme R subunit
LDKQITEKEKQQFIEKTGGKSVALVVKELLNAFNPDVLEAIEIKIRVEMSGAAPEDIQAAIKTKIEQLQNETAKVFTGDLNDYIENVRKAHEQKIDLANPDEVIHVGWDKDNLDKSKEVVADFTAWMQAHKDELTALQIFYNQPYRRRELTSAMIKEVLEKLLNDKPTLAPLNVWRAYEALDGVVRTGRSGVGMGRDVGTGRDLSLLIALVSLIRKVSGLDATLTPYDKTVDKNFQAWVFKKQAGATKFNEEQMQWLRMIKDYVVNSFHIDRDDFDLNPFNAQGGLGKMWQLFGDKTDDIINELNEALAA